MSQAPSGTGATPDWTQDSYDDGGPASELEIFERVAAPSQSDEFFTKTNLGQGYYDTREYWQQVDAYKNHLYADSAFGDTLSELAIYETQFALGEESLEHQLARDGIDDVSDALEEVGLDDVYGRRQAIAALGMNRWENLGREADDWKQMEPDERRAVTAEKQLLALEKHAGTSVDWTSPFGRMIAVRHEASRSRGARLLDNLFGRVREQISQNSVSQNDLESSGGIL